MRTTMFALLGRPSAHNDATLVDFRTLNNQSEAIGLWVRHHPYHPYVVHRAYFDSVSGALVTEQGGYFAHLSEAIESMSDRASACSELA